MIYILNLVNIPEDTLNIDLQFLTMEDLMKAVQDIKIPWTSIMVTILPEPPKGGDAT